MMSLRNWLALLVIYILYLLMGGYAFHALENPTECLRTLEQQDNQQKLKEKLEDMLDALPTDDKIEVLSVFKTLELITLEEGATRSQKYYSSDAWDLNFRTNESHPDPCFTWNLYNSVFFSFTAVTTIGYGHLSPTTDGGKILCIFYSLLGVPINAILIGSLGTFFSSKLNKLTRNVKRAKSESTKIALLIVDVIIYLIPGVAVFLVLPAGIFCVIEDWNYLDSFYYAFITLTTIGFGDFVSGRTEDVLDRLGNWQVVYEIALMAWIVFGLGYIFMIITVIADALKKPARRAAKTFNAKSKVTMTRILQVLVDTKQSNGISPSKSTKKSGKLTRAESVPSEMGTESINGSRDQVSRSALRGANKSESTLGIYEKISEISDNSSLSEDDRADSEEIFKEIIKNKSDAEHSVEENEPSSVNFYLSDETIVSLKDLVKASKLLPPDLVLENNFPKDTVNAEEKNNRKKFKRSHSVQQAQSPTEIRSRKVSELPGKKNSVSTEGLFEGSVPHPGPPKRRVSDLQDVLQTTTLAEFLLAAEKVNKLQKSEEMEDGLESSEVTSTVDHGFESRLGMNNKFSGVARKISFLNIFGDKNGAKATPSHPKHPNIEETGEEFQDEYEEKERT